MEDPGGKRRRMSAEQSLTYRDKVLQVVKARLNEATPRSEGPSLHLPENMESNGEASSIISQAIWRLGHLQGMLLFGDLRNQQLLPERDEAYHGRLVSLNCVTILKEKCHDYVVHLHEPLFCGP